jgi:hypothetical protein
MQDMAKRTRATERLCSGDKVRATVLRTPTDRFVRTDEANAEGSGIGIGGTSGPSPVAGWRDDGGMATDEHVDRDGFRFPARPGAQVLPAVAVRRDTVGGMDPLPPTDSGHDRERKNLLSDKEALEKKTADQIAQLHAMLLEIRRLISEKGRPR